MKLWTASLAVVLVLVAGAAGAAASPSAADAAQAGALAAQIKTPAVRAAMQCRVAFADTTATVPVKGREDVQGAGWFWANYLKKLGGIDVAGCPGDFQAAFGKHLRAIKAVTESLDHPTLSSSPGGSRVGHTTTVPGGVEIPDPAAPNKYIKGRRDLLGDCAETYKAVFAAANRSMKTAPAADGQLAGRIDGLLKE